MAPWLRLRRGDAVRGVAALALFGVLAAVFLSAEFDAAAGFPSDASITASIGYALFDLGGAGVPSEGLLAAFEIVDLALVAALVGAVTLARREGGNPLSTSGTADDGEGGER